ncbi:MAG: TIGR03960 family B12-binding radical SAM protein, partial [Deferribacterota bacterium]|nr:TIGR03960 family B12-binding radical SAM protein [Deferribacterota bacterium]
MRLHYSELLNVEKPLRYSNLEINISKKDIKGLLGICLIYPDLYEIGMSNYGLQLLYNRINRSSCLFADRFYMPYIDAINTFQDRIYRSLEYKKKLNTFDIVGFSLQSELTYSNILSVLEKGALEVFSNKRRGLPIIIAGGSSVYNPSPLMNFIDIFFFGEMENKLVEVCEELYSLKLTKRHDILRFFDSFDFCYVPQINRAKYIKRHIEMGFSRDVEDSANIIPLFSIVHDRAVVEVARGCTNGCRFCQAGYIYRPLREKSVDCLFKEAINQVEKSGQLNLSFISLSVSDYSDLEKLIEIIKRLSFDYKCAVSLPSIRADLHNSGLLKEVAKVKQSGFTIAAEAGSDRLRKIINKNITNDQLIHAVVNSSKLGYRRVKIYFMIGLPFEKEEDIEEIIKLSDRIKKEGQRYNRGFKVSVSISNFVAKPFTPFQWYKQNSIEQLYKKVDYLKKSFRRLKIEASFHDIRKSVLESIISRGDNPIGDVIYNAYKNGAIFDEWSEHFDFDKWILAFEKEGINYKEYYERDINYEDCLPWDNIDIGVSKKFLVEEYKKSKNLDTTKNCAFSKCSGCGVCDFKRVNNIISSENKTGKTINIVRKTNSDLIYSYALRFAKLREGILLSALDVTRLFSIVLRSIGINLDFTKGYHKQPKLRYIFPLPVGVRGLNELIFFESEVIDNMKSKIASFNREVKCGIKIKNIERCDSRVIDSAIVTYRLKEFIFNEFLKLKNE